MTFSSARLVVAAALVATALALTAPQAATAQYDAPDPGGNESAFAGVPPQGKLFGMNDSIVDFSNGQSPNSYASYVESIGGTAIRTILDWAWAEPFEQDQLSEVRFQKWRDVYDAAKRHGLRPIFLLASAPFWARGDQSDFSRSCQVCPFPPADNATMNAEWGEYVAEIARRFPDAIIQVWNEANLHYWWGFQNPDPERYAELADIAYDAVQQVELQVGHDIPVIAPGLANVPDEEEVAQRMSLRRFLERAYAAPTPLDENIDGLATNAFPHSLNFGAGGLLAETFQDIREEQDQAGDDSPIWVTETGIQGGFGFPWDEVTRAQADLRLYNRLTSIPDVAAVLFHRIIEPVENDPFNAFEFSLAWLHYVQPPQPQTQADPAPPKPVYCMFTQLARDFYAPCLEVTITDGPKRKTKKSSARFEFQLYPEAWLAATECSLDGSRYKPCQSGKSYRGLDPGKHSFKVRGRDGTGKTGRPDTHKFTVKKKKKKN